MRCRICAIRHKNTQRHKLWIEEQVCRVCANVLEFFSFNDNRLKEYWIDSLERKGEQSK